LELAQVVAVAETVGWEEPALAAVVQAVKAPQVKED